MERLVRCTQFINTLRRIRSVALLLILAILGLVTTSHGAPTVAAALDARRFSVDQAATLTITINDAGGTIGELPRVDGLDFQPRGRSSQHQIINGSLSSSVSTIFQVQASRPGTFTIPPIAVTIDGKQLQTEPITFEVTSPAAGVPSLPNPQGGSPTSPSVSTGEREQMAFLRISPVKEESYPGEVMPVEIKAYFRRGLRANLNTQPRLNGDGFVLSESKQEPVQTEEMVDNVPYSVLTWPGSLSGIKEGKFSVSVAIEATLLLPDSRRRGASMGGDPFFGNDPFADFFNQQRMQEKKIRIVSKEMSLQVLALPAEGKPADFSGAIGKFELQVKAQPTDVGPGDPITLTMTVAGSGNFDRVEAPVLSQAEGWKSYSPSAKFTPGVNLGQGRKVFEQAIIARSADTSTIPPLVFSFFDPEAGKYQTLHSDPIPLHMSKTAVGKSESVSAGNGASSQKISPQKSNGDQPGPSDAAEGPWAPLHSQMGSFQQGLIPLVNRTGFQLLILVLLLLLVAVIVFKIRARRLAGNPVLCRQREMARLLDLRLREIRKARELGNSRDFLAICRRAIQEQLGLLWQTGPGAITLADLRQRLAPDSELIVLFATAESGAYVGNLLNSQEMADYAGKLEHALRQLR
jgi:hypothetical protein